MSRHWKPDGEDGPWGRAEAYLPPGGGRPPRAPWPAGATAGLGLLAAACVGAMVGLYQAAAPREPVDPAAIEWDAVQAVPSRAPDAEDREWERRATEANAAGLPRTSGARNDAVRAAFGTCHSGGGTNCVVDGDTFWIGGEKVRIAGIDAPETHPPGCAEEARLGDAATERLRALLNSGAVTMTGIDRDRDRYGRLLRNVAVDGQDVGEAMVSAGVARDYGSGRRSWC
jgi:endonuclease YncB( thermonuclease family)